MSLGKTLKQIRREQGMTLAQLAAQVDSHVGNLSRIERDLTKPSLELLFRLAKSLDYHLADIFALSDESHYRDPEQLALNTVFISLLADDRDLLLEFAKLLKTRASRGPADLSEIALDASGERRSSGLDHAKPPRVDHKQPPDYKEKLDHKDKFDHHVKKP
ncbi:helix-turn-helix domain-containing protein [Halomonas korlensis]|uniref:DNA-binding transcriptional regulator, XRE-family HTH domain n=1 Tax=Halomonas korlensis TaxID=463301 RepID=A0A1I7KHC6_9GAMM|nr:helix-turn-helix transcriptional regulator [Halomonas korlensis]SFU96802.1 DNA-binding transcriptional regulator, XRE-family HTH domain [Halomonas korlensis]